MPRLTDLRRSLNEWARGPETASHDPGDLQHFTTYFTRRAVAFVVMAYILLLTLVALGSALIWGELPPL